MSSVDISRSLDGFHLDIYLEATDSSRLMYKFRNFLLMIKAGLCSTEELLKDSQKKLYEYFPTGSQEELLGNFH